MPRVKVDCKDWQNDHIRRVVNMFADAQLLKDQQDFGLTPAQACLVWWGLNLLNDAIRDSVRWCSNDSEFSDTLRCHADAAEWSREFMGRLWEHAKTHGLEAMRCR